MQNTTLQIYQDKPSMQNCSWDMASEQEQGTRFLFLLVPVKNSDRERESRPPENSCVKPVIENWDQSRGVPQETMSRTKTAGRKMNAFDAQIENPKLEHRSKLSRKILAPRTTKGNSTE
jgi:hypothetical protein